MAPLSLKAKGLGAAMAVYLLGQPIQCPFIIPPLVGDAVALTVAQVGSAAASFGGAIAGGAVASNDKRGFDLNSRAAQVEAPEGVPQYNFDQCVDSLVDPAVSVTVTGPVENNGVQIDGLTSQCMVLGNVITGDVEGPVATPCGSACLLYNNLDSDQYSQMQSTFEELKNL
ncbi:uncharacterized protein APUU_70836S [Aspergillus puulaauensis]|uniref:Uncharacterized protein n=1 Tax=Aspergillus puulaauensis TaxID=1220207 RepID=A0A7R7XX02_9EURO|nr:uncharacterized protein APUU_70836S [Aspergillus puulaauensis]BCS29266.1 hypothetical protein APUU_70836S [Aspergillus puulaauensis]